LRSLAYSGFETRNNKLANLTPIARDRLSIAASRARIRARVRAEQEPWR
jgi:hypothetical protein